MNKNLVLNEPTGVVSLGEPIKVAIRSYVMEVLKAAGGGGIGMSEQDPDLRVGQERAAAHLIVDALGYAKATLVDPHTRAAIDLNARLDRIEALLQPWLHSEPAELVRLAYGYWAARERLGELMVQSDTVADADEAGVVLAYNNQLAITEITSFSLIDYLVKAGIVPGPEGA